MISEFRRQFILGKKILKKDWKQTKINNDYFLSSHEDLEVNQIKENDVELTLIGYIINPHKPDDSNVDCLNYIAKDIKSIHDLSEALYIFSGRFILIGSVNKEMIIISDPCGLRQVFYTEINNEFWFASQPNLLVSLFNINKRKDQEVVDFISSPKYENSQRCWIGNDTIYENIFHLMPNYFFDFRDNTTKRYWVNHEKNISFHDAIEKASIILKGSLDAIAKRGKIIQGLTAGWDSRMLLSASKSVKNNVQYYISLGDDKFSKSTDLKIAQKLSHELNLNLHEITDLKDVRDEIASSIKHDVTQGRNMKKTRTIQYFYDNYEGYININGNISEIVRHFYGYIHPKVDSDYLIKCLNFQDIPFVKKNIETWMNSLPEHIVNDIEIPDLMYWEQKMGNWCAMQKAEQDIAIEDFSPFNNRQLLMTLYNVEKKYREPGSYILYREIMGKLWEETLSLPINPVGFKDNLIKVGKRFLSPEMKKKIKQKIMS